MGLENRIGINSNLGRGTEFVARIYPYSVLNGTEGSVLKKTYYPRFDSLDNSLGQRMKERAESDLELIKSYFGESLVSGARIVERFKKWYISQPYYGKNKLDYELPQLSCVKPTLAEIFAQNDKMIKETGFTLDMIGADFVRHFWKYRGEPDFWSLDSFRVKTVNNNPELRLVDTGLLWTQNKPTPSNQFVGIHEYPASWIALNMVLPIVKERVFK